MPSTNHNFPPEIPRRSAPGASNFRLPSVPLKVSGFSSLSHVRKTLIFLPVGRRQSRVFFFFLTISDICHRYPPYTLFEIENREPILKLTGRKRFYFFFHIYTRDLYTRRLFFFFLFSFLRIRRYSGIVNTCLSYGFTVFGLSSFSIVFFFFAFSHSLFLCISLSTSKPVGI